MHWLKYFLLWTSREVETSGSTSDSPAAEGFGAFGCGHSLGSGGGEHEVPQA